jgi:hypothetical protein
MFVSIVQTLIKLLGGLLTSTFGGKFAEEIQSPWANACYTFYEAFLAPYASNVWILSFKSILESYME